MPVVPLFLYIYLSIDGKDDDSRAPGAHDFRFDFTTALPIDCRLAFPRRLPKPHFRAPCPTGCMPDAQPCDRVHYSPQAILSFLMEAPCHCRGSLGPYSRARSELATRGQLGG